MTPPQRPGPLFHATAIFLLAAYPFLKFVHHHGASLVSPATLLILAGFAALGLAAAWMARWPAARSTLYALVLFLMLTATGRRMPDRQLLGILLACAVVWALMFFAPRLERPLVTLFIAGCLLAEVGLSLTGRSSATRAGEAPPARPARAAAPAPAHTLHLVLDEHIGPDGLPGSLPGSASTRARLLDFYTKNGFTVYTKAHSNYHSSQDSIPSILNDTYARKAGEPFETQERRHLRNNRLFDVHAGLGHAVRSYQSGYMDYCGHPAVRSCYEYGENSARAMDGQPYSALEKTWVMGSQYLATNGVYLRWLKRLVPAEWLRAKVGPLSSIPAAIQRLGDDMEAASEPTLFFAHLLMPHSPYVYDAACRPLPVADWMLHNSDQGYALRYERYDAQIGCLSLWLDGLFARMKEAGLWDTATIVAHGDHGSRIVRAREPTGATLSDASPEDMASLFSTLMAVRLPNGTGRVEPTMRSVTRILHDDVLRMGPAAGPPPDGVFVRSRRGERELTSIPLKPF